MPRSDCTPNCDINATYIDMYQRGGFEKNSTKQLEKEKAMKQIRRKFVCHKCRKYPGDEEWSLGTWEDGPYTCFDCL